MSASDAYQTARKAFLQIGVGRLAKGFVALAVVLGIGFLAKSIDFEGLTSWVNFSDGESAAWYQGKLGYYLAGTLFTAIGGPRQVVAFFAAYIFGFWSGLAVAMAAVVSSCIIDAVIARIFENSIRPRIRGKVDIAFGYWRENPISTTIIIRLLPVGSNFLTSLAAGATGVPLAGFVFGSAIGYVPQMAVFALMGSGVDLGEGWQVTLGIALFGALTIFGLWIYGRYRRKIRSRRRDAVVT